MKKDIFERSLAGEPIGLNDPESPAMAEALEKARRVTTELNTAYHELDEVIGLLRSLGGKIDTSARVRPPFYTDCGRLIELEENVFVNQACVFMDRGGISVGKGTKIGPRVNLITENHGIAPSRRTFLASKAIRIGQNVWIGAAATILPGVTVGDNAIVAAGSVVSHDVPPNTIVAGIPAKVIREIGE